MKEKEMELLLRIAESVGELFEDIKAPEEGGEREIHLDQSVCEELWNHYYDWVDFLQGENPTQ